MGAIYYNSFYMTEKKIAGLLLQDKKNRAWVKSEDGSF